MQKIIALLTDFGIHDGYTGVMKGVILNIHPDLRFVDITHSLKPFNIQGASFLLFSAWDYFPKGTVFLSVVDPGVGTSRRTLFYSLHDKFLITPDNGTVSLLKRMYNNGRAVFVSGETINMVKVSESSTFHGRDIFGPLAAHIAKNGPDFIRGEEGEPVIIPSVWPDIDREKGLVKGKILHIDRFGNCISSIHYTDIPGILLNEPVRVKIGKSIINDVKTCFSDIPVGDPLVYKGSSGFFEVAVREGNAASLLNITVNMEILMIVK